MALVEISRELQFKFWNMVSHIHVLNKIEEILYKNKGSQESHSIRRVHGFSLDDSFPEKKRSLFSFCWILLLLQSEELPLWVWPIIFNWCFCLFYISPLWSRCLSENITDRGSWQIRGVGWGRRWEETYVYLWLIHLDVWQNPT